MITSCSCGRPATHMVTIRVAPSGATVLVARKPGRADDVWWGCYAANHVPTMAQLQREYARAGLEITEYEITELWEPSESR